VLDATTALVGDHHIGPGDAKAIRITMPDDRMHIVDNRSSPDLCVQHLASIAVVDGTVSFEATHDHLRMSDPIVQGVRSRITMMPSPELTVAVPARQAIVEIDLANGTTVRHHAKAVRGTPDNPMTTQEIEDKAHDLVLPIIGSARAGKLVEAARNIETMSSLRELRPLLQA
jgi:2-methylcitrate dehydratase PrpD